MKNERTFVKDITELARGNYRTLGVSIPANDVKVLGLRKSDKVEVAVRKYDGNLFGSDLLPKMQEEGILGIGEIPDGVLSEIKEFREEIPTLEKEKSLPILVIKDEKSDAYFAQLYIRASDFLKLGDANAVIDPELQEEFKANRQLEPNNPYFIQMKDDADEGRTFTEVVIEYNTSYPEGKNRPLKILGGQHRHEALKEALKKEIDVYHGIKVYFNLDNDQRAEIMRISNTNINVSSDLRDRIEETILSPPMLRPFCFETGMLEEGEDFGDKRRYEEDFSPTVRMIRSFIVNFFRGTEYEGDIDTDAIGPYLCKSGKGMDEEYKKIFDKFKDKENFDDESLVTAGEMFAKLHNEQFKKAGSIDGTGKKEYKIKSYSMAVITSWAYAAGVLQRHPNRLKKLYSLPKLSKTIDPLNAIAMGKAKHKTDPDNYRGLGTRNDEKERGRLLHLFLGYSKSDKPGITLEMCNAAISIYHSNEDRIKADEAAKKAF